MPARKPRKKPAKKVSTFIVVFTVEFPTSRKESENEVRKAHRQEVGQEEGGRKPDDQIGREFVLLFLHRQKGEESRYLLHQQSSRRNLRRGIQRRKAQDRTRLVKTGRGYGFKTKPIKGANNLIQNPAGFFFGDKKRGKMSLHYEVYRNEKTGEVCRLVLSSKHNYAVLVTRKNGKDHVEKMTHGEGVVKTGEMFGGNPDWVCSYSESRKEDFPEETK